MKKSFLGSILIFLTLLPLLVQAQPSVPSQPFTFTKVFDYLFNPNPSSGLLAWYLTNQLGKTIPPGASPLFIVTHAFLRFLIPVLGVFLIVYGFLDILRIFRQSWINLLLAIIMCLTFLATGWFTRLVYLMFRISSLVAVFVFGLMFIGGIWLYRKRRMAEWGSLAAVEGTFVEASKDLQEDLKRRRQEYERLARKLSREKNWIKRASIRSRMREIKKDIDNIVSRARELREERDI